MKRTAQILPGPMGTWIVEVQPEQGPVQHYECFTQQQAKSLAGLFGQPLHARPAPKPRRRSPLEIPRIRVCLPEALLPPKGRS